MDHSIESRTITVGVTGGIAAYKVVELVRGLTDDGHDVRVMMTAAAQKFIAPLTFQTVSGNPVATDLFQTSSGQGMNHLKEAWASDLVVIAPGTANTISKIARGEAGDLLTATVLAAKTRVVVVPSMNERMYLNPATQANIATLSDRGVVLVGPTRGRLASGHVGIGRMEDIAVIRDVIDAELRRVSDMKGRKVVVTAGPTFESIDPVRYIGNRSSGRMGYAMADEASRRGAEVTLVSGPVHLHPPAGVRVVRVESAADMEAAVRDAVKEADTLVMAAAVSDQTPNDYQEHKVKKGELGTSVKVTGTTDILASISGEGRGDLCIVGFAAETDDLVSRASLKLHSKSLDMIVGNDVSRGDIGFGSENNEVVVITPGSPPVSLPKTSKRLLAADLWDRIGRLTQP